MSHVILPEAYQSVLDAYETQSGIGRLKHVFAEALSDALHLKRVSAPLFVDPATGLNDDLNGIERPVSFSIADTGRTAEVVHSLAKWKRMALYRYHFHAGKGLYTDMNAIRRDEVLDNLHSVYVDQWDWEVILHGHERTLAHLQDLVRRIVAAICDTQAVLQKKYPQLRRTLQRDVHFITAQELYDRYPHLDSKERENAIVQEYRTVFIIGIGWPLSDGQPHDGRAPDYDDWTLNGDLLFWNEILGSALEISSMGIRVDAAAMDRQLTAADCNNRRALPFHRMVLDGTLPQTAGGGIGQSRLSLLLLEKAHIGEVQSSVWDEATLQACANAGIVLL